MITRVAIPVVEESLGECFGNCIDYVIYEVDCGVICFRKVQIPAGMPESELPLWLSKMGITDVIAYKIDPAIMHLLAARKINLFVGIQKNTASNLMEDYLNGKLESDGKLIKELGSVPK